MTQLTNLQIREIVSDLIPSLSSSGIDVFLEITHYKYFNNQDIIIPEGDTSKNAIFILDGVVRGFLSNYDGTEKTILLRDSGIFVIHPKAAFNGVPSPYSYESLGNTHGLIVNLGEFEKLAFKNTEIMKLYLGNLKEATIVLNHRVEMMINVDSKNRYVELLKRNPLFIKTAYKKYVANYLGITPVSLSRIISSLKNDKPPLK